MSRSKARTIGQVVREEDLDEINESAHRIAWKHAYIAYYEPESRKESPLLMDCTKFIRKSTDLDFAYFVKSGDYNLFSFRGTDTEDKNFRDNVRTWFSNLDGFPLRKPKDDADAIQMARENGLLTNGSWGQGTIHDGFYTLWAKHFKPWVRNVIKKFNIKKGDKIIFTGHSRGGTQAELGARDIAKNLGIPCSCYTYGCPGVGTKAYQDEFRLLPINGIRTIDGWDIVVDAAIGFKHGCLGRFWYRRPWIFKLLPIVRIHDHWQSRYDKKVMS